MRNHSNSCFCAAATKEETSRCHLTNQLEVDREDRLAVSLRWPGVLGAHGRQRCSLAGHQGGLQEEGRALKSSPRGGRAFLAAGTGVSPNLGVRRPRAHSGNAKGAGALGRD